MFRVAIDYLVYVAVRVAVCVVQALPLSACRAAAGSLATLCCDVLRLRRGVIEENLQIAYPELSAEARRRMAWQMWEHLFLMVAEIAHAPRKLRRSTYRRYVKVRDIEGVVATLLSRRQKVIVAGHYGNFELSGYMLGLLGFPTFTVARTLDNRFLDRWINEFRSATGQFILPSMAVRPISTGFSKPARRWRCSAIKQPDQRAAGSIFSADRLRRTRPWRCLR